MDPSLVMFDTAGGLPPWTVRELEAIGGRVGRLPTVRLLLARAIAGPAPPPTDRWLAVGRPAEAVLLFAWRFLTQRLRLTRCLPPLTGSPFHSLVNSTA